MEETFTETTVSYRLDDEERMERNSYTTRLQPPQSPPDDKYNIIFIFSCRNTLSERIVSQDSSTSPRFLASFIITPPVIRSTMYLDLDTLLRMGLEGIYTDIERNLESWLLDPTWREYMARFAVVRALQKMICMPQLGHDSVFIDVSVVADWTSVFHEDEFVAQMSAGDNDGLMIPALNSSIEALEKKEASGDGTCAICMDDYGRGCEVACMPCSHLFHEGCMEEWLHTSHYCPICRFEMPTRCEDIVDCSSM